MVWRFWKNNEPKNGKVNLDCDKVVEFPKLPEMQQITATVLRFEEHDKR